jgi:hypothetical protein
LYRESDNKREIDSHDSLLSKITALGNGLNSRSAIGFSVDCAGNKSHMDKEICHQRESFPFNGPEPRASWNWTLS